MSDDERVNLWIDEDTQPKDAWKLLMELQKKYPNSMGMTPITPGKDSDNGTSERTSLEGTGGAEGEPPADTPGG